MAGGERLEARLELQPRFTLEARALLQAADVGGGWPLSGAVRALLPCCREISLGLAPSHQADRRVDYSGTGGAWILRQKRVDIGAERNGFRAAKVRPQARYPAPRAAPAH